jgi:hypothetical protein
MRCRSVPRLHRVFASPADMGSQPQLQEQQHLSSLQQPSKGGEPELTPRQKERQDAVSPMIILQQALLRPHTNRSLRSIITFISKSQGNPQDKPAG